MQRRSTRLVPLNALLSAVALGACMAPSQRARSCAAPATESDDGRAEIATEPAIIVWDEKRQIQHFIRRATFDSTASSIGFLVPTPSTPELAVADDESFSELECFIKPKVVLPPGAHTG
jgi:hypothetical protein